MAGSITDVLNRIVASFQCVWVSAIHLSLTGTWAWPIMKRRRWSSPQPPLGEDDSYYEDWL